ncbi:MAG: hypothetical protein IJO43_00820 [Bacilli bacterium]|nr:hypothetical protein [Bacilli bacterium]
MYNNYIGSEVVVIVSSRAEALWEYIGVLSEVDDNFLKLKSVEINQMMLNFQKNMFGAGMGAYENNIDEVIINKNYIISCYKK